jgi:hypothetical protein
MRLCTANERQAAVAAAAYLLRQEMARGALILEDARPRGCGLSCFVSSELLRSYRAD